MTKAGHRRLKAPIRCPDCGRGVDSLVRLRQHARMTGCDIAEFEARVLRDVLLAMLGSRRKAPTKGK